VLRSPVVIGARRTLFGLGVPPGRATERHRSNVAVRASSLQRWWV
jgi:hypothetical protein